MSDEERFEYEKTRECWYYEERYRSGTDYALRHDSEYVKWLEDRQKEDRQAQIEDESTN